MRDLKAYKEAFGVLETPFYLYDIELLGDTVKEISTAASKYGINVRYAVKANVEERLLRIISAAGIGADAVSGNEVRRAVECGFPKDKIVFAGVGKTDKEIRQALGIEAFNVESLQELEVIDSIAASESCVANVSLRINPGVDAHTHKFITTGLNANKFGLVPEEFDSALELLGRLGNVRFTGLHFHIGSQITDVDAVYGAECRRATEIARHFQDRGLELEHIDLGGGLGVDYDNPDRHPVPDFDHWFRVISEGMKELPKARIMVEPGRSVVAECGSLITRVLYTKSHSDKSFVIVDAGMNNLVRPALYGAYHRIDNLTSEGARHDFEYDVVGPVCESSDVWGSGRMLPETKRGDLLAIRSAGAYGSVMSSLYNLRDLAPAYFTEDFKLL